MTIASFALVLGILVGLRAMTPPAAVSWAARLGILPLAGTWLGFLAHPVTPWILTTLAAIELVTDQLPKTPSRKVPVQFGARLFNGTFCGVALGVASGALVPCAVLGAVGAVIGTLGGAAARGRLAKAFGKDLPAALLEDAVCVGGAVLVVLALR